MFIYDLTEKKWYRGPDFSIARRGHSCVKIFRETGEPVILIAGGFHRESLQKTVEIFDFNLNEWTNGIVAECKRFQFGLHYPDYSIGSPLPRPCAFGTLIPGTGKNGAFLIGGTGMGVGIYRLSTVISEWTEEPVIHYSLQFSAPTVIAFTGGNYATGKWAKNCSEGHLFKPDLKVAQLKKVPYLIAPTDLPLQGPYTTDHNGLLASQVREMKDSDIPKSLCEYFDTC